MRAVLFTTTCREAAMNIRGGNKHRIDRKKQALKRELDRPPEEQNFKIIERLKKSIARNKKIDGYWRKVNSRKRRKKFK